MELDIIIPSFKNIVDCMEQIEQIKKTRRTSGRLIFTGLKDSASVNRNWGLEMASKFGFASGLVLSIDDDVRNFFDGFDLKLAEDFIANESVAFMISARLLNKDESFQNVNGDNKNYSGNLVRSLRDVCPSACIIFRSEPDIRFFTGYLGSSWEDSDICMQYKKKYPHKGVFFSNGCKLIHLNEAKNQIPYVDHNQAIFFQRWQNQRRRR